MKKYTWLYLLIPLFICLLYIEKLFKLNTNLQTNFDEGFYFLSIWKVKHGILNEGLSLWTLLINATCSEKISSTILNLRYLRFFTQITTITIFTCITSFYLVKKGILNTLLKIILYISLVFWIGYFTLEDKIITYNELQSFFLSVMIALFLLSTVCQSKTELYIYFIIGFISFLSFVTIPPSGIIVSISIFIMILTKYWNYKKKNNSSFYNMFYRVYYFSFIYSFFHIRFECCFEKHAHFDKQNISSK